MQSPTKLKYMYHRLHPVLPYQIWFRKRDVIVKSQVYLDLITFLLQL